MEGQDRPTGRGQAHTLEAFAAATILLASIVFALQVTAVTPLTASTSSQHIENQQEAVATGILASAEENGTLTPTLLYVNNSTGQFHNASFDGRYVAGPPTAFGEVLNETFLDQGIAFNLYAHHQTSDRTVRRQTIVRMGGPSDNAISARWQVTLYDDDVLYAADETETTHTLENSTNFYADDQHAGPLYNVVEVEVVVWRM